MWCYERLRNRNSVIDVSGLLGEQDPRKTVSRSTEENI